MTFWLFRSQREIVIDFLLCSKWPKSLNDSLIISEGIYEKNSIFEQEEYRILEPVKIYWNNDMVALFCQIFFSEQLI